MRKIFIMTIMTLMVMSLGQYSFGEDAVYLADVQGTKPSSPNEIISNAEVTFTFNFRVETGCLSSCFIGTHYYSQDGATWTPLQLESNFEICDPPFGRGAYCLHDLFGSDGMVADTIAFSIINMFSCEIPQGFDDYVFKVHTSFPESSVGKTLCIDSCFIFPSGVWTWEIYGMGMIMPSWDGPHCFEIIDCCYDYMGDINLNGQTDVSDLTYLVAYMFQNGDPLPCLDQADFIRDYFINISDLTYFIAYLFQGGPPMYCP